MELEQARSRLLDKKKARVFLYHPDEDPLMVYEREEREWLNKGWFDSPAKFMDMKKESKKHGIPQKEVEKAFDDVKRDINEKINIHSMNATELADFLNRKSDGGKYDRRQGKKFLLEMAEAVVEGETVINVDDMEEAPVEGEYSDKEIVGDNSIEDNSESVH